MMEILSYSILAVQFLMLINALLNWIFGVNYQKFTAENAELISVIIPVRNEERNIGNLLSDLQNIHSNKLEIIVVNDDSDDQTAEIVQKCNENDNRIRLINAPNKPSDWLGKNFACYTGAQQAKGEFLLFIDADVRLNKTAIDGTLAYLKNSRSQLLSVFPVQKMTTEKVNQVVPLMNFILLSLLPLPFVRYAPFASMAAANGQFMFFETATYRSLQPHRVFCSSKVEDIQIARFLKKQKRKVACVAAQNDISCTMYANKAEAINGFSKNVAQFFGGSHAAAMLFWVFNIAAFIPVIIGLGLKGLLVYLFMILVMRIAISVVSRQSVWQNLQLHYVQIWHLGLLILKSIQNNKNKRIEWKGRNVY